MKYFKSKTLTAEDAHDSEERQSQDHGLNQFKIKALTAEDAEEKRKNTHFDERAKGKPAKYVRQRFVCYLKILTLILLRVLCVLRGERVLLFLSPIAGTQRPKC